MKQIRLLAVLMALVLVCTSATNHKTTTIFIIGDSTAANKDISNGKKERGWGMALQACFDPEYIVVDNHAVNGRSSLSFMIWTPPLILTAKYRFMALYFYVLHLFHPCRNNLRHDVLQFAVLLCTSNLQAGVQR